MTSVREGGSDPKRAVCTLGMEAATKQRRPFAHPDQPVPTVCTGGVLDRGGIADRELERGLAERHLDSGGTVSVAGGVGQSFLQDSVGSLVGGIRERLGHPLTGNADLQAR